MLYIDGRPFVLRSVAQPFRHLQLSAGLLGDHLEKLEVQLKADVIAELEQNNGKVFLHDESADGTVTSFWKMVRPEQVLTPAEVAAEV
jgi:hypothetical protein